MMDLSMEWLSLEFVVKTGLLVLAVGGIVWRLSSRLQSLEDRFDAMEVNLERIEEDKDDLGEVVKKLTDQFVEMNKKIDLFILKADIVIAGQEGRLKSIEDEAKRHTQCAYYIQQFSERKPLRSERKSEGPS
jgi:predicted nuclease with TOPRIM domain